MNAHAPAIGKIVLWTLLILLGAAWLSGAGHSFFPEAVATLRPANGSSVTGTVAFAARDGGVHVSAEVAGLAAGEHGFHVHERGDCSAVDASSAGAHLDHAGMPHAGPDSAARHAGDLGNLRADSTGRAQLVRFDRLLALGGPASIVGRAVVVHEDRDDLVSQPSGNSGARVACGVIRAIARSRPRRASLR